MKILFYGHKGWIGQLVTSYWKKIQPDDNLFFSDVRINPSNYNNLEKEFVEIKPDRIFSSIGRTFGIENGKFINNIDYLENRLHDNLNDNLYAPIILAQLSKKYNVHMTYIGTGCIFSRDTNIDKYEYTEDDIPDFFGSSYSIVKGYTEQLIKHFDNVLNLRIRMPIIKEHCNRNFVTKIMLYEKIYSMSNSMTYLPDLIPIMINMSKKEKTGTFNFTNKGSINHKEILDKFNHTNYKLIEEQDLPTKSKRSNNILSTKKLENEFELRNISECIDEMLI